MATHDYKRFTIAVAISHQFWVKSGSLQLLLLLMMAQLKPSSLINWQLIIVLNFKVITKVLTID
ncbi:hypothetical protein, partial [Klebsiella pneumoniae]|uniref:hypothetical protein n=1 Tax=Klebsiella pneumoniae TaxID=573 RepID=UPI003B439125